MKEGQPKKIEQFEYAAGPLYETQPNCNSKEGVAFAQRIQVVTVNHGIQVTREVAGKPVTTPLVTECVETRKVE